MQQINIDRYAISGRGEGALLAWKLSRGGRGVDEVVVPGSGVGGSRGGLPEIKGGRNSKYMAIIAIQIQDMANAVLAVF